MQNKRNWLLALCLASCFTLSCSSESVKGESGGDEVPETKCQSNADCKDPAFPICADDGTCIVDKSTTECRSDGDCKNEEKPVCSALGTCIAKGYELECTKASDCKNPKKPVCSAVGTCISEDTRLRCVKDADCTVNPRVVCSAIGTCVEPNTVLECTRDADCSDPNKPSCSTNGTCEKAIVSCEQDTDCPETGYICKSRECVLEQECDKIDSDGDTIADIYEGRNFEDDSQSLDTDGDTVPDYLDLDSDGDTLPDSVEGGTKGCSGAMPVDSDGDGVPDFQSKDSDGNGIPDSFEGCRNTAFVYNAETGKWSEPKDVDPDFKKNSELICNNPIDSDGDGVPDFRARDNDGDGLSDEEEIRGLQLTSDDTLNGTFGGDCNGDGERDLLGTPETPIDCDGDTIPDYMDTDSDGDTIPDAVELSKYQKGVDLYARYSKDADGDTIPDSYEGCHREDLWITQDGKWPTPKDINPDFKTDPAFICKSPVDTDGDTIPDYVDLDSDDDGLSDAFEFEHRSQGFNAYKADSDGDEVDDLVEFGAGTNPGDKDDNPQSRGNFVFITPFAEASRPKRETLSFDTGIQSVDVYFSLDSSVSMTGSVTTLRDKLPSMLDSLLCPDLGRACESTIDCRDLNHGDAICSQNQRCIISPQVGVDGKGCFANMWTGLGTWGNVNSFINKSSLSNGSQNTLKALNQFVYDKQGDNENSIQPSMCALYGASQGCNKANCHPESADRFGCVGFRKGAIKIYVQAGDEPNFNTGHWEIANADEWGTKLKESKVTYVGLFGIGKDTVPENYQWTKNLALSRGIAQMACYSGSCQSGICAKDCKKPDESELEKMYVAPLTQNNINTVTRDMLLKIAHDKEIQITTEVEDIDAGASQLIDHLEVNVSGDTVHGRVCTKIEDTSKITSDQYPTINGMKPSTTLCFDVIPVENQKVIQPLEVPKVYRAKINVLGDGSVLNSGIAYFLVPSEISQDIVN